LWVYIYKADAIGGKVGKRTDTPHIAQTFTFPLLDAHNAHRGAAKETRSAVFMRTDITHHESTHSTNVVHIFTHRGTKETRGTAYIAQEDI
jgi:hypothetical protein